MKKAVSDKYLLRLWHDALILAKGSACLECGLPAAGFHHIYHRRHMVTRYLEENGIPLCVGHHSRADRDQYFALSFLEPDDKEHLMRLGRVDLKTFLWDAGLTENEWLLATLDDLKSIIAINREVADWQR